MLKLGRVLETVRPSTYEPATGYRTLQALAAAVPELLAIQPPELVETIELVAELAGRYGTELIPDELRRLAASRSGSELAVPPAGCSSNRVPRPGTGRRAPGRTCRWPWRRRWKDCSAGSAA